MKLEQIFFDFDGVLVDSVQVKTKTFETLFAKYGKEVQEKVIKHHLENGGMSRYKKFQHYYNSFLNKPHIITHK